MLHWKNWGEWEGGQRYKGDVLLPVIQNQAVRLPVVTIRKGKKKGPSQIPVIIR